LRTIEGKDYEIDIIKQDLHKRKRACNGNQKTIRILAKDDSKIKCFGALLDKLQKKILTKSYWSSLTIADTINYFRRNNFKILFKCKK
jgi:hypothetical protein